ncbi:hypothetical protein [uncultured Polaribacter sp.]|uniref:CHASE3 domain-containing protein n=1 Tax=uncultured Polaribacter sp. TaxID=174711 RepID=UPI00262E1095|nr:hypothetical protein [uncultured Polaribacter sp.]
MKHDIRDLFDKEKLIKKELPNSHRKEFINKLQNTAKEKTSKKKFYFLKVASVLILMIVGVSIYFTFSKNEKSNSILAQVDKIEKEYIVNINKEWNQFIEITDDTKLVNKYQNKLNQLKSDYKKITRNLQENPDDVFVLESLISNLQQRLELIKNIKEHINELNQNKKSNETIYI